MATLFGGNVGGIFSASVLSGEVYDPVYDTDMPSSEIYQVLPSFYRDIMSEKELFEVVWSAAMQYMSGVLLHLWQVDYSKSIQDVPVLSQRKWVKLELGKEVSFDADPELTRVGIPGVFSYTLASQVLTCTPSNRARHDRNIQSLNALVDQDTSLSWSVQLELSSAQRLSSLLFGYFDSTSSRLANSISVGVLGSESAEDTPRPFILHADPNGEGSAAVGGVALSMDAPYRLDADYTAATGIVLLSVVELRSSKLTSSTGFTENELGTIFTNVFQDSSVNFDTEGIVAGDILSVFGGEYTILSVDGAELTVTQIGLSVDVEGASYEILGEVETSSLSLNIPADASDPTFTADQYGAASLDTGALSNTYVTSLGAARRKSLEATTSSWSFLDPTVEETLLSLPRLQDAVTDPQVLLYEGTDYTVDGSTIRFQEPPPVDYWAEYIAYDEEFIKNNFGLNVGLDEVSSDAYKARVQGLYYAYFQGPTPAAIRTGVHILLGLPIAAKAGTVEAVNPAFSGDFGLLTIAGLDYLYPVSVGTTLSLGDTVARFEPLSNGVEVVDYLSDPRWFTARGDFSEVKKYHTFQVQLSLDVFGLEALKQAGGFVDDIKPTWKDVLYLVFKNLEDQIEPTDELVVGLILEIADQICDQPPMVVYDDTRYLGGPVVDWMYDQGLTDWDGASPAMQYNSTAMSGTVTLTNGSTTATGSSTSFLSTLGGPGPITDRRLTVAVYRSSTGGVTTAASHVLTDPAADFLEAGREVQVRDVVTVTGEGTFLVLSVDSATQLTLDGPLAASATGVTYTVEGKGLVWSQASTTTSDTVLDFSTVFPGASGVYQVALINNAYFNAQYDQFEELCPDEELVFEFTLDPGYVGAFPVDISAPDTQTSTVTLSFTVAGEVQSSTLAEP